MHTSARAPITVSIVSHGQQAMIAPLLEQLEQHCSAAIAKVILTRNLPEPAPAFDGTRRLEVQQIHNAQPQGFGANHNVAFTHCETEWFLVLNPDIRLDCDVMTALLELANPDTGLLAPRIREPGKADPEPYRGLLTPFEILQRHRADYTPPPRPAWVPGMFLLARTTAYREVRGFDPRFFMYGEDFDLCARLQLAGWEMLVADHLSVRHDAQRASRRQWRHLLWHCSSLIRLWSSRAFWRYRRQWHAR